MYRTDVVHAETVHAPLVFQGNVPLRVETGYLGQTGSTIKLELRSLYQPLGEDVITILQEIRYLCDEYSNKQRSAFSEAENRGLSDCLWPVERRALMLAYRMDWVGGDLDIDQSMSLACSLTALIFVHWRLRDLPVTYRIFDRPIARLQAVLASTDDLLLTWTFAPELLVWALVTGATVSHKRPQKRWFDKTLATVTESLGISRWPTLRNVLRNFIYLEADDSPYVDVWKGVETYLG